MKDFFSGHSQQYAAFRPTYPEELYRFLYAHVNALDAAWDCGTGNGQVARELAKKFTQVYATDISAEQLRHAAVAPNITYAVQPAEQTTFADKQFDLITVAQALHWFDAKAFYREVKRTAKPGALLAVWGYSHCLLGDALDPLLHDFYANTVGPYWDSARAHVEERYQHIPFPFTEIPTPEFSIKTRWTAEAFAGYLTTWSATQKFIHANGYNPVLQAMANMQPLWGPTRTVTFPLFLRLGIVA